MTGTAPFEKKIVIVSGASSGFGRLAVQELGKAGHTVYAGMRDITGRNAQAATDLDHQARSGGLDLNAIEMDVSDDGSVDAAIAAIIADRGHLDVVVHNAGHNRAVLPHLRAQRGGLVVWVGSSSTRGGCPPFLAPYFGAKAALDAIAVSYAGELIRFGIDTSIVVPGAFTRGTNHFASAGTPADTDRAKAYDDEYGALMETVSPRLGALLPQDADAADIARAIAAVVDTPAGKRPFRVHVDPSKDGCEVVAAVADRIRVEFYHRIGLESLLTEHSSR